MDEKRKGEIALKMVEYHLRRSDFPLEPNKFRREIGNISKETWISAEEILEVLKPMVMKVVEAAFNPRIKVVE